MKIRKILLDPLIGLEDWLNSLGKKGYKLTNVSQKGITYSFKKKSNDTYIYTIDFVANRTTEYVNNYIKYLEDCEYTVFKKALNILQYSKLRIKFRIPLVGQKRFIATNNTINNELLIICKKSTDNNTTLNLYSEYEDIKMKYTNIQRYYIQMILSIITFDSYICYSVFFNKLNHFKLGIFVVLSLLLGFYIKRWFISRKKFKTLIMGKDL